MIGAIVITLILNKKAKAQIIHKQVTRNFSEAVLLVNV
jgi:hypothetical protein